MMCFGHLKIHLIQPLPRVSKELSIVEHDTFWNLMLAKIRRPRQFHVADVGYILGGLDEIFESEGVPASVDLQ